MIWATVVLLSAFAAIDFLMGNRLIANIEVCTMLLLMALATVNDSIRERR